MLLPSKQFPIKNVTFDPRKQNVIILHDDANIIVIDKEKVSCFIYIVVTKVFLVVRYSKILNLT